MKHVIVCECGTIIRGDNQQELLSGARAHMQANHPAIAAQITDDELLALSEEQPRHAFEERQVSEQPTIEPSRSQRPMS